MAASDSAYKIVGHGNASKTDNMHDYKKIFA